MREFALIALAAALLLVPQMAMAQAQPQAPLLLQVQAQAQKVGDVFGLTANQVLAIGVGAVGGVIIAEAVHATAILGAIVGGALGNWWYAQNSADLAATVKK